MAKKQVKNQKKGGKVESKPKTQVKSQKTQSGGDLVANKPKKPGQFVKGDPRIKPGRELGSTNFKTDFLKAIAMIKNADTKKAIEITDLIRLSLEKMIKAVQNGDHRYDKVYIDLLNRYYGTPTQNIDHTTKGEKMDAPPIIGMRIINEVEKDKEEDEE